MVRWRCVDALGDGELEGCASVVHPVTLLLVEGHEGVEEVHGGARDLKGGWRLRWGGKDVVGRGGAVLHFDWRASARERREMIVIRAFCQRQNRGTTGIKGWSNLVF